MAEKESTIDLEKRGGEHPPIRSIFADLDNFTFENLPKVRGIIDNPVAGSPSEQSESVLPHIAPVTPVVPVSTEWKPGSLEYRVIITLCIVCAIASLDSTIFFAVLPTIAESLHGNATSTFWVGTAYLVPCAAFQPFISSLSDIYGRRIMLLVALSLFMVGSIVGAVAQNITTLLAGRAIQGMGGGGLLPLSIIVMSDIFPLRLRPKYMSIIQAVVALFTMLGPVIGGLCVQYATDHGSWRWILYINFPLCAIAFPMILLNVNLYKREGDLRSVDWFGGFLFISSMLSLLIGSSWAGVEYPWTSYQTLLPLCLGLAGVGATLAWEQWGAANPFITLSILRNRSSFAVYTCTMIQGNLLFGALYYLSLYLEAVKGLSPTLTGVGCLPVSAMMMPSSIGVAILISRYGRYKWALWIGWVITLAATALMSMFKADTNTGVWIGVLIVLGLGHGFLFNGLLITAQVVAPPKHAAEAAALYTFVRTVGFSFGVVIGGTTFQNIMKSRLKAEGLPMSIATNAEAFIGILLSLPKGQYRDRLLDAYSHGLDGVFEVFAGIGGLSLLATLFIARVSMDRPLESNHVLRLQK